MLMGFIIGYLAYDMVHYYVHHATPTTRVGRYLRQVHMLHHFRDPEGYFGVSAPYWDVVFGTRSASADASSEARLAIEERLDFRTGYRGEQVLQQLHPGATARMSRPVT